MYGPHAFLQYTLLAKKLCDSSFLGKRLIHSHFNMYGFRSYLFWTLTSCMLASVVCVLVSITEGNHEFSDPYVQFQPICTEGGVCTYFAIITIVPLIRARR